MDSFEPRRNNRFHYSFKDSSEEYSYDGPNTPKSYRSHRQNFSQLFQARERFCQFAQALGPMRHSELRQDILNHCEQNSKRQRLFQRFMSDETILRLINMRIEKMIKNKRIKKNWSQEDVQILVWMISKYADKKNYIDIDKDIDSQDWEAIARLIPGVSADSCMFKWLSLKKTNLATNNWSKEESAMLSQLVTQNGMEGKGKDSKDWKIISQKLFFQNPQADKIFRNAKQCREHWNCYLNPNLKKGPWKHEQDIQLLRCIKQNSGSKKWSQIVKHFDGRTQNALKNRYTLIIEKQKKNNKHKNQMQIVDQYLMSCYLNQFTDEVKPQEEPQQSQPLHKEEYDFMIKREQSVSLGNDLDDKSQIEVWPEKSVSMQAITPVKVEVVHGLSQFLSERHIDVAAIQVGTLSNGIFQKSDHDLTSSMTPFKQFKLQKFNSMS